MKSTQNNDTTIDRLADLRNLPELPKHTQRRIYWDNDGKLGQVCLLVGYCPDDLAHFLSLFYEARKTFPRVEMAECTCAKVSHSNLIYGFTILLFSIPGPKREIAGYENYGPIDFNY